MSSRIRITSTNASHHIGCKIEFKTHGKMVTCTITGVSPSGKTLYIAHPDLGNNLVLSRAIYLAP